MSNRYYILCLVAFFLIASNAAPAQTVSYWKFNEGSGTTAGDSAGTNHGTLYNAPEWVAGISGTALKFNGSSQYVQVSNGLIIGTLGEYTIEAWVKWEGSTAEALHTIYCEGDFNDLIVFRLIDGAPDFTVLSGNWENATASSPLSVGVWYHLAAVLKPGIGGRIFVNGVAADTNSNMGIIAQSGTTSVIGRFTGNSGGRYFNGTIDEIRISNVALEPSQFLLSLGPPGAPQNLAATAGNAQVGLTWSPNTEPDFLRYRIYGGTSPNPTTKIDSTTAGISDTSKIITGLTNGTTYYFRITAMDSAGNESGYSNEVSVTNFAPPTISDFNPKFGPVGTNVTITGTNFSTTASKNIVYFGAVKAVVTSASPTSLTVTTPVSASFAPIAVTDTTTGLTAYSIMPFIVTFPGGGSITASSFVPKVDFATGTNPSSVVIADFDTDGKSDLALTNESNNTVSVFRNTSTSGSITAGSFTARVNFTTGSSPGGVAFGDFDGDGKLDLAVTNYSSNTVSVFHNSSTTGSITSGSFAAKVDFATETGPTGIAIYDLDEDGKPDIAVTNYTDFTVSILRNTSTSGSITAGSFAPKVNFTTGFYPWGIAIGDVDQDTKPDLVIANYLSNLGSGQPSSVAVFRNTSTSGSITTGSFSAKVEFTTGTSPAAVALGDLDGDGKLDLAISDYNSNMVSLFRNTGSSGSISFATKVDFTTGSNTHSLSIGDIDGDGKPDIAITNRSSNTVSVLTNTSSTGSITSSSFSAKVDFVTGNTPSDVSIGDLDGDGKPELIVANQASNTVSVFRNTIGLAALVGEYQPDANTVLLLHMNETSGSTVSDASSFGNNGTATGTTIVDGRFGKGRSFNGTTDQISIVDHTSLNPSSQITIEAWIYPTSFNGMILRKDNENTER
ncbi:MAG: VCBS repeat-containing protein, partial [Ignavibacteriales bacterium]|nr:VCBS repeat-containing protein [Ignavibacteriales bacterium]